MEVHQFLLSQARKEIAIADHFLFVTFPLTSELKILIAVTEHIITAANSALQALLEFEHAYKRLELFPKNFEAMILIYQEKVAKRYNFNPIYARLLEKLAEVKQFIRACNTRFVRQDKYVFANSEYKTHTLEHDKVKKYCKLTKDFIGDVEKIITKP